MCIRRVPFDPASNLDDMMKVSRGEPVDLSRCRGELDPFSGIDTDS